MSDDSKAKLVPYEDLPDHIEEQVNSVKEKLSHAILPIITNQNPQVVLSAFNSIYASLIVLFIDMENVEEAKEIYCDGLKKNMDYFAEVRSKFRGNKNG